VTSVERHRLEEEVRALLAEGRADRASTVAIEACEIEITRWLKGVLADESRAREVFCAFCEDLWKGLPNFRWQSSLRTWAYKLARNAAWRHLRSVSPEQPMGDTVPDEPIQQPRSRTRPWLRSDVKSAFARLRETLDPEDRTLLLLRIDGRMRWDDIAQVTSDAQEPLAADALRKKAAALRQQFHRIKTHLREMAEAHGLLAHADQ
jgi:RNA polymerase sigma-70 factor, ECF subfamily